MREAVRLVVIFAALLGGCKAAVPPTVDASPAPSPVPGVAKTAPSPASNEQFIAIGTEPFWNAKIGGGAIVYSTPEEMTGQSILVTETRRGSSRTYTGAFSGQPFVLTMREAACSDGMSDRSYRYEVALTVGGGERKGCAEPGTALKAE